MVFLGKSQLFQKAKMQSPRSLGQRNPLFVCAGSVCSRPEPEPARGEGPAQPRRLWSWICTLQHGSSSGSFWSLVHVVWLCGPGSLCALLGGALQRALYLLPGTVISEYT